MYSPIWKAVLPRLSAERMRKDIAEFFQYSRWSSFDRLNGLARCIADKMREIGMEDVRLIDFPADGKSCFGGWVMPLAYDVQSATLHVPDGDLKGVLADYRKNPTSLMLYSMPTPSEGITAELAVADTIEAMTPERVAGKLALTKGIGVELCQAAMRAGAYGLVSDCRNGHVVFKNRPELDVANEWHNYTIPPGAIKGKGFGFSISPASGRKLRERLAKGVSIAVKAVVKCRHYAGVLPVVSGILKGALPEEIVLTGHYDEFGADDNCSQIAVALESCRAIKSMAEAGEIPPLLRTIRVLLPMEVRGFNALIQNREEIRHIRAGLNIDTVGTDQNASTSTCTLSDGLTPSYADDLAVELLARTCDEYSLFRWRRTSPEMIDNIFGEPMIGAPVPQIWHFSATHHLSTDSPDTISLTMLMRMARLTATYAAFLAGAGLREALWLAELSASIGKLCMNDAGHKAFRAEQTIDAIQPILAKVRRLTDECRQRVGSAIALTPPEPVEPWEGAGDAERVGGMRLAPEELYKQRAEELRLELEVEFERIRDALTVRTGAPPADAASVPVNVNAPTKSLCVPVKTFRGFLGLEDLKPHELETLHDTLRVERGWGAPMWLQHALFCANGKRTAAQIAAMLHHFRGKQVDLDQLERIFELLSALGRVRLRPYLTRADICGALVHAGIESGDVVLGHFSLSWFGYIEGGADMVIDALLEILGPDGTLVMPAFSFSWAGRLPFDASRTPSRTGEVTERFRTRQETLRSAHPTHSFAACGREAGHIVAGHDYTQSPLSANGPLGRVERLKGKILMFAPPRSNTSMHVGEYRGGMPLLDLRCSILENGAAREVLTPDCPWHVQFDDAYDKLYARNQIREAPLGEQKILTMRAHDAIAAQEEVMRETPHRLLQPGCSCPYCTRLKEHCDARATA